MREIKFRGIAKNTGKFVYGSYIQTGVDAPAIVFGDGDQEEIYLETLGQFTGLYDKNGKEIYESDLLNIFFTSGDQEHSHDCVYEVEYAFLGLQLVFRRLLWESHGFNQYPIETTLCERYGTLTLDNEGLLVPDTHKENHLLKRQWKGLDRSRYFEVIGNIHENPEMLED